MTAMCNFNFMTLFYLDVLIIPNTNTLAVELGATGINDTCIFLVVKMSKKGLKTLQYRTTIKSNAETAYIDTVVIKSPKPNWHAVALRV